MKSVQAELLQTIAHHTHLPVLTLDLEGRITGLNPAAESLLVHQTVNLIGQPFTRVLDPGSHSKVGLMIEEVLETGQVDDWELDHVRPGGSPFLIGYSASLLRDEAGRPMGIIAVGRDLSRQLDLTRQLAETNQQLEGALLKLEKAHAQLKAAQVQLVQSEKMRSLGQMVAGVAHEINNPAAFVANNLSQLERMLPPLQDLYQAYALLRGSADETQETRIMQDEAQLGGEYLWTDLSDLVKESREGIERIRNIVLSLRSFSHVDDPEMVAMDANECLRASVKMMRSLWNTKIEIIETYGDIPSILCRPGELNQVFLNLMTNALQAIETDGGHGTVWVASAQTEDYLEFSVRDNGHGMDESTLARLGEPFFTTRAVGSGTGLGLAVCFGIIERHGGRLDFISSPGKGTTAIVKLPIKTEAQTVSEKRD